MDFKFLGIHSPRQHNPLLSASSLSSVSPHNFVSDHPVTEAWLMLDTREAIEREIAKELLRSEILADEIAQQCLKRDMMIEPDTMGQPFGVPVSSLKRNLPPLPSPVVERSSELCLDTSDTKMEDLYSSNNNGEIGPGNFEKSVNNKQPLEIKNLATCDSFDLQEWRCELCQISAPCEKSLNDHLAGKKHQAKMEALNGSKNGDELAPRNIMKSVNKQPVETKISATCVSFDLQEWSCELCQISAPCEKSLNDHLAGKKHRSKLEGLNGSKNGGELGPRNIKKSVDKQPLETKNSATCVSFDLQEWSCELCQISAPCEKSLNDHLAGKKHQAKMEDLNGSKNSIENGLRNFNKSVDKQPMETMNSAKCVSSDLQDWSCSLCQISATSKQGLNDHLAGKKHHSKMEAFNASKNGGEIGLGNTKKSVNKQPMETKNSATCFSFDLKEWRCDFCQINANSEKVFNNHLAGKKHQAKMEALNGRKNGGEIGPRNTKRSVNKQPLETKKSAKCVLSDLQDWSCSLCQIRPTSEQGLIDHLSGKKHKSNMEALKNGGDIGLRNCTKSVNKQPLETKNSTTCGSFDLQEWSCSLCQISATSEKDLNNHLAGKKHRSKMEEGFNGSKNCGEIGLKNLKKCVNKQPLETIVSFNLKKDRKTKVVNTNQEFKLWCRLCQVVAPNEKGMIQHKEGKKHLKNLLILCSSV